MRWQGSQRHHARTTPVDYRLKIRVLQGDDRCLARTQSWTLTRTVMWLTSPALASFEKYGHDG